MERRPEPSSGRFAAGAVWLAVLAALVGLFVYRQLGTPSSPAPAREQHFSGATMGTSYSVRVAPEGPLEAARVAELSSRIQRVVDEVDAAMSTYKPESEVSRFNRHRSQSPFPLSAATAEVVAVALEVAEQTGGALDITVAPLVEAWGFGRPEAKRVEPGSAEYEALRARVGYRKLTLEKGSESTLRKADPELSIDLSAVAKGYAADRVARVLEALGLRDFMVEVGGEVRAQGHNARGERWRVAIERPDASGRPSGHVLGMDGLSVATSGSYRNWVERGGRRWSHTFDPRAGLPVEHRLVSVTVAHPQGAFADALATALQVLGPVEGPRYAREHRLPALFIEEREDGVFVETVTPAMESLRHPCCGTEPRS